MSSERSTHSADDGLGPGAECAQVVRQLVGAGVEFAIGERGVVEDQRDGVGRAGGLGGEQLGEGGVRNGARGVVPGGQDGVALVGRENVEAADRRARARPPRRRAAGRAARRSPARWPRRTGRWRTPARPPGRPARRRRRARSASANDRSNLAPATATASNAGLQPRQLEARPAASFWNASITWNSGWCASERAGLSTSTSRSNGRSWWA